jgi:outer membrane biogenesis lipoprotein LolB
MTGMRLFAILLACLLFCACTRPPESAPIKTGQESSGDEQYKKGLDEIRKDIKGDLKIKLKRDGKGDFYSWEISGKDAAEVLRANDVLVKKLGTRGQGQNTPE